MTQNLAINTSFFSLLPLYLQGIAIIVVGHFLVKFGHRIFKKIFQKAQTGFQSIVLAKIVEFLLHIFIIIIALDHVGLNLKVLLGAAGIFTVAIGFASQTSASNFISGLFLVSEKPFRPGDVIKINDTTGIVISIDLLSTRIRTLDNLLIRVPNENLMKSQITNITYFDIRRVDIKFYLGLHEDLENFERTLVHLTENNPFILDEPRPMFVVDSLGEMSVLVQFSFWVQKENYLKQKNKFCYELLKLFRTMNIQLPFSKMMVLSTTPSLATDAFGKNIPPKFLNEDKV